MTAKSVRQFHIASEVIRGAFYFSIFARQTNENVSVANGVGVGGFSDNRRFTFHAARESSRLGRGRGGLEQIVKIDLTDAEQAELHKSAENVRVTMKATGV